MDTKYLRAFICLAEELHFRRTAEKLNISQPLLSALIKSLEEQVGTPLFIRTTRSVQLTTQGALLLGKARSALMASESFLEAASDLAEGISGTLNIFYSSITAHSDIMGRLISRFQIRYPEININMIEHSDFHQSKRLIDGEIDVGFFTNLDVPHDVETSCLWLSSDPLKVIMPRNHHLADKSSLSFTQLAGEPFIVYATADYTTSDAIKTLCGFTPDVHHQTSHPLLLPSLVSAGLGIAIVPDSFRSILPANRVVMKDINVPSFKLDIMINWMKNNTSQALSTFINFIHENTHQTL